MKNVADIYGLSPMQRLMLLHAKTTGTEDDVLFNQIVYTVVGPLNTEAYRRAWQHMVDRHSALRTLFVWQEGKEPVQVVREEVRLPWVELDWRGAASAEQEAALDQLLAADRSKGFDLLQPPAMRFSLIRISEGQHWLMWSSHHLIIDRWCIGILFAEISNAYEAFTRNSFPALTPAPRHRDYIAWLAQQDEEAARSYWRDTLQGLAAKRLSLESPAAAEEFTLATITNELLSTEWQRLRQFALDIAITQSTLITGGWAIVLAAATGANDTLFGLTVSGRPAELAGASQAIGCYINNVPLRLQTLPDAVIAQWLRDVQQKQLELTAYEYASPSQIQSWSGITAHGPLFDTLVVLQSPVDLEMPTGLSAHFTRGGMQTGYPISLGVVPSENALHLYLTYDQGRVPQQLAYQLMIALKSVLLAMPDSGDVPLQRLKDIAQVDAPELSANPASAEALEGKRPFLPPQTPAQIAIADIWSEVLNLRNVSIDEPFFDSGGDSISALRLLALIDERLHVHLPTSLLFRNPTIADIAERLADEVDSQLDPVLQAVRPAGHRPPFFYAHGVFGDVSSLRNLAEHLGEGEQPLYGLEAIGLRSGHEPDRTMEAMAARYVAAIRQVQPSGPYYLGGFCFGGVLAYEMACQLEQIGEHIALLAIVEGSAPLEFHTMQPLHHPQRLEIIRQSFPYWRRGYQELGGWRLRERLGARLRGGTRGIKGQAGRHAETDNLADFNANRPEIQFRLREINVRAIEDYTPRPFGGHVTLFRGRAAHIGRALTGLMDPQRGWGSLAGQGVTIRYVDGTHVSVLLPPNSESLAAEITAALREAQTGS